MEMNMVFEYLSALEANNNREWYHAHKEQYKEANRNFEVFLRELMIRMEKTDSGLLQYEPKELTFKLVRDTRFGHDKSPYNPVFRAHLSSHGKLPVPVGYFVMISPGGRSFFGGGLFADVFKDATEMIRSYIASHGEEWERIITDPAFCKYFTVRGSALKRVPAGYDKEHPQAEYLKYKSWYLEYPVADEQFLDGEQILELAEEIFTKMKPFNAFLNRALADFKMPER